jgi:glycosyltransferase involved in cell wall biosynthesis
MDIPLVSVIIPAYNAAKYISDAIESTCSQTHSAIEVIVVDDGSTDQTAEVARSYSNIIFKQNDHQGACIARNTGLSLSKGEYIQFLDADDILLPHKIKTQLPFLTSNHYDTVFCNGYLFGDDRPQRPIKKLQALLSPVNIDPFVYCLHHGFGTEGPLHRRSLLEKVNGFRARLAGAQEYDLHVRLAAAGARLHKLDDYLFCHRNHDDPNRITRTTKPPGFMADTLMGLLDRIQNDTPDALTSDRRRIFASTLYQASIYAYRKGAEVIAARGFQQAQILATDLEYVERPFYKFIANSAGPMFAEGCLKQARLIRDLLKRCSVTGPIRSTN